MEEIRVNVEQKNGVIGFNFEEIKEKLNSELEIYKNMIFTEDSKTEAKKTIASLRKLKKSVNDKKLEVKKSFMIPYTNFEAQVKELDNLIDEPINFINNQVEEFERRRVEEKKSLISEIYTEIMAEHEEASGYLPLQRIYDSKWENATTTKKAITEAIAERVDHVEKDLGIIRSMGLEFEDKGIEKYKATLELSDAIEVMNQYQKQKEEILRRQEEEAKRKAEEEARKASEVSSATDTPMQEAPVAQTVPEEKIIEPKPVNDSIVYEIIADPFQIVQLEAQMRSLEIKYRRVR
jgi:hypothetical protein|nr:MAG TPA: Protein of unknown function (DUF1351) [Caudoviricetes sp.]